MNNKKILSFLLVMVMLVGVVVGILPVTVEAAHSPSVGADDTYTNDEVKQIVLDSYKYEFASTAEMLAYELSMGYLDSTTAKGGKYTMYINRYTGTLYYLNNATGQILCSNPADPAKTNMSNDVRQELMSQVIVYYTKNNGSVSGQTEYLSSKWAGEYAQISVSAIDSGLRVTYAFGDTATRYIVPGQITAKAFYEYILNPLLETYRDLLIENIGEFYPNQIFDFYDKETWGSRNRETWEHGEVGTRAIQEYISEMRKLTSDLQKAGKISSALQTELYQFSGKVLTIVGGFSLKNPAAYDESTSVGQQQLSQMHEMCPLTKEGVAVYVRNLSNTVDNAGSLRKLQNYLLANTYYSKDLLEEHEAECGYSETIVETFVFRCSIEYSFNEDGTLSVRLPSNSVTYDNIAYYVTEIAVLPFFGAGNLKDDGYLFIPDGSGAVIEYEDFYNSNFKQNLSIALKVYGDDYVYTTPSGYHKESVIMPVYGNVSTECATGLTKQHSDQEKYSTGFVAIVEEGDSMATLRFQFGGTRHYYTSAYSTISLYPSDVYDLTDTITVSGVTSYRRVSESRFTGSFTTRYAMLGDETLSMSAGESFYPASYVGMASFYRDYLKSRGELASLEISADDTDLPLYIEALGSMNIVEKFLTFPVTVSRPLTTFDDVVTMYNEFARANEKLLEKAAEYHDMAAKETKNAVLREKYEAKALEYERLSAELSSITDINFKLTGFANGGMYFTYPTSVRWESACGGNAGLNTLISATKGVSAGQNFSIYPEFDFLYKSNSALFDGTDNNRDIARMLDDRFASKKEYNSVLATYESLFSLVISTDSLDRFYTTFAKSYKNYGINNISLSTLGSDLNSNINVDNFISREESKDNIVAMLGRVNQDGYKVMLMNGNSYTWAYADHILDIPTDSSHLAYTSYTIPFTGLVLHSYVSYTGAPLNYTGSPDYDILRSIENGASLYYILCFQNTNHMKEDNILNKYYGVDYENWYDDVVSRYNELNSQIGDLQAYEIVDHRTVIAERVIDANEIAVNNAKLKAEFVALVRAQLIDAINEAYDTIFDDPAYIGIGVSADIDVDKLILQASEVLNIDVADLVGSDFEAQLNAIKAEFNAEYPDKAGAFNVTLESIEYTTQYKYVTDSFAEDEDYVYTDYTVSNDRVVIVVYQHPETGATSMFLLNYNVYAVTVRLEGMEPITLDRYDYHRIDL